MAWERPFVSVGITLVLIGIALILVPIILKLIPTLNIERVPWFIIYIYRKENVFFATSPILIIIEIMYLIK